MAVETKKAEAQRFQVRVPLLSEGRVHNIVARAGAMTVAMKCYAEGGENALHTHLDEPHVFVILQGQARFWDENGETGVFGRNEGILVPAGWFYRFESCGDEPLVMLRVGHGDGNLRVAPDGHPLPSDSAENLHVAGVPIPGKFYE
ncbi:MAG TPA: cupin domain-containing protein [Chloroflexota bacterium]|jgi:mannose-6-phosphate isomerase-like protein (cupin superfamily)